MSDKQETSLQAKLDSAEAPKLEIADSATVDVPSDQGEGDALNNTQQSDSKASDILKLFMKFDPFSIGFAFLILVGGIIGFVKKDSKVSLIFGAIFFLLLLGSTYLEGTRRNPYPLIATLFALYSTMLYRFTLSSGFMPSGLIALLALLMLIRHEYLLYLRRTPPPSSAGSS